MFAACSIVANIVCNCGVVHLTLSNFTSVVWSKSSVHGRNELWHCAGTFREGYATPWCTIWLIIYTKHSQPINQVDWDCGYNIRHVVPRRDNTDIWYLHYYHFCATLHVLCAELALFGLVDDSPWLLLCCMSVSGVNLLSVLMALSNHLF